MSVLKLKGLISVRGYKLLRGAKKKEVPGAGKNY